MKLVVPHVAHRPGELRHHLGEQGLLWTTQFARTDGAEGYWRLLAQLWREGSTFVLLEADKFPATGVLRRLWSCPQEWCYVNPPMRAGERPAPYPSLSCVKFGARLMQEEPGLLRDVGELDLGLGVREWSRLDMGISGLLEARGYAAHEHHELVEHRHGGGGEDMADDQAQEGAERDASQDVEINVPADGTEVEVSNEPEVPAQPQPEEGAAPGQEPDSGAESGESSEK